MAGARCCNNAHVRTEREDLPEVERDEEVEERSRPQRIVTCLAVGLDPLESGEVENDGHNSHKELVVCATAWRNTDANICGVRGCNNHTVMWTLFLALACAEQMYSCKINVFVLQAEEDQRAREPHSENLRAA